MTKKIVSEKKSFELKNKSYLEDSVRFIHQSLTQMGISKKLVLKTELLSEETIVQFARHATENAVLFIQIRRFLGDASVSIRVSGEAFDPYESTIPSGELEDDEENAIRSILFRAHGEKFKYSHKNQVNRARILVGQSERTNLYATIAALFLGLLVGAIMKFILPGEFSDILGSYVFNPVKTMFMNALKIVIAPVVFFSIVTCVSQFKNIAELGKIGIKVMGMYIMTTVIAVLIGITFVLLIKPGEWGFATAGTIAVQQVSVDTNVDTSILHTIVNIVPSNFVQPFLESDTLQIIFLAVICGIAVGMIGEYSAVLKEIFEACNSLFLTITTMIAKLIPVAVFCSVILMIVEIGGSSLLSVLSAAVTQIFSVLCMICVYGILVLLVGRLNPLKFFSKNKEGMLTSFSLSSSSAAMPTNMRICTDKLGISSKVSSFSIPLGATVNMDGTCIYLSVLSLFLARAYGVEVPISAMISLGITIILLSLGAPGVPGSAFICLGVVLKQIHVPVEAVGLIMAVTPILDMFDTMSNTTGDMTTALIVAKSEKLLDLKKYNE